MTKRERTTDSKPMKPARRKVTGWKLWVFRLIAVTVIPAAFFLLLEGALRVVGFGYPTSYFVKSSLRDEYITNVRFGWRFFPPRIARAPLTLSIRRDKPDRTYRIFTLGASASLGFPDPAYNYGRVLEVMLEDAYPQTDFEVVNVSMTAINSHVVQAIARECAEFEPDMFIVYLGNNEVVGPYGPGTVFEDYSPSLAAIRASLWVKSMRSGQLIERAVSAIASAQADEHESWGGMSMFLENQVPADDPRLETVYESFRENLRDICEAGIDAEAPVLLCTVASNLGDNPPFASVYSADLSDDQLETWQALVDAGIALSSEGEYTEAMRRLDSAIEIDDGHAELWYRRGKVLEAMGRIDEAREAYVRARDLDALRFRADRDLNGEIQYLASDYGDDEVALVDVVAGFENPELSENGIPGDRLFHEHVHLTFEGNHALAGIVFREVVARLPSMITSKSSVDSGLLPIEACAEALALTDWDRYTIARDVDGIMSQPPFTNQIGYEGAKADRAQRLDKLERSLTPEAMNAAERMYLAAVDARPNDLVLRDKFAHLLSRSGKFAAAVEQWEFVVGEFPEQYAAQNALGLALVSVGQVDDAINHYRFALRHRPGFADAHSNLGMAYFVKQDLAAAIREYERAIELEPDHARAHYNLGIAHAAQGREMEAMKSYRQAIEANPEFAPARNNLATALLRANEIGQAIEHLEKAIEIDPGYVSARRNLGIAYQVSGQLEKAIEQFEAVLLLAPGDEIASRRLNQTLQMQMQQSKSGNAPRSTGGHPGG